MVSLIVFACLWAPFLLPCIRKTEAFLVSPAAAPPPKWTTVAPVTPWTTPLITHTSLWTWRDEAVAARGRVKGARGWGCEYVGQRCRGRMMCELCGDSTSGDSEADEAGPSLQPSTAHGDGESERSSGGLLSPLEPPPSLTPSESPLSGPMINFIKGYKMLISPILPPACRFLPTCSEYAIESIEEFGPAKGAVLTAWRLVRCNPTGGRGYDPPVWPPPPYNAGT